MELVKIIDDGGNMNKHNFKKKYGQNFISDVNLINRIVNSVNINSEDLVLEIGPGAGSMTKQLIKKCNVIAYEIDSELKEILNKLESDNLEIIWDDFLLRDLQNDISKYRFKNIHVIANIPYYITTPIIEKIINSKIMFENVLIMVQKEVAERFSSIPGNKSYGQITVFLNHYFEIKKLFDVNKDYFYPTPKVDSSILLLRQKKNINILKNEELFFKLIKDSFQFKRKTLKNNLKNYDLKIIDEVLKKYNLSVSARAEQLSYDIFVDIANNL